MEWITRMASEAAAAVAIGVCTAAAVFVATLGVALIGGGAIVPGVVSAWTDPGEHGGVLAFDPSLSGLLAGAAAGAVLYLAGRIALLRARDLPAH